jgi:polyisoprenoid-binding protein YceI
MRARLSALALVVIASSIVRAQSPAQLALQRYSVDPMHSTVGFATTLLGGVKVRGRFNEYDATIVFDPAHPERSSVSAIIQAKSINTDMKFRDDHLRSPDFFDVDHYPTIQFVSERVVPRRGLAIVSGTLTMHGVSRAISFPAKMALAPYKVGTTVGVAFAAELRINRKDFGIAGTNKFNPDYNPLTNMLSDSVDILLEVDAIREGYADRRLAGGTPPGIADTVNRVLVARGIDAAVSTYRALHSSQPTMFDFTPYQLDLLGHQLAERGELANAVVVHRLNVEQYADSAGVLESLAESQALGNDGAGALTTYRRAMAKFPQSANAREMVRRLERLGFHSPSGEVVRD